MSRTRFGTRFRELVGESPIHYLARVRLSQAAGYLTTTNSTLYAIAQHTGYDSEGHSRKPSSARLARRQGSIGARVSRGRSVSPKQCRPNGTDF